MQWGQLDHGLLRPALPVFETGARYLAEFSRTLIRLNAEIGLAALAWSALVYVVIRSGLA